MHRGVIAVIAAVCLTSTARAENAACWGDDSRQDITCVKLTERLFLGLRGQTVDGVRKAMNAPGVERQAHELHFLSNYSQGAETGSGTVNVLFEDGRATVVSASVDLAGSSGSLEFVWNAYAAPPLGQEIDRTTRSFARPPYCSDISGKPAKCSSRDGDGEMSLSQMQGNLTKAELLQMLEASCNMPGVVVSDPAGDCARLRARLR